MQNRIYRLLFSTVRFNLNSKIKSNCHIFLVFLFFPVFHPIVPVDFQDVYGYYKQGNYDNLVRVSRKALSTGEIDYRILLLYVATESDPSEIEKTVSSIYSQKNKHPALFYNALYLYLERLLVLGDYDLGKKWGQIFFANGRYSVRYKHGVYTFACILYDSGDPKRAGRILKILKKLSPDNRLSKRIKILEYYVDKA